MVDDKPPNGGEKIVAAASTAKLTEVAHTVGPAYEAAASVAATPTIAEEIVLLEPKIAAMSDRDVDLVLKGPLPVALLLDAPHVPHEAIRAFVRDEKERRVQRTQGRVQWTVGFALAAASFGLGVTITLMLG